MDTVTPGAATGRRARSPHIAALLSFLWPGLGQWYGGRTRAAILFAAPVIGIVLLLIAQGLGGVGQLAALVLSPSSALTVAILIALLAIWRLLSIADALTVGGVREPFRHRSTLTTFAILAGLTVLVHGILFSTAWAFYDASSRIFVADVSPEASPPASAGPGASVAPTDEYVVQPAATPETHADRINILLTGVDSAEQRTTALTDTLLIASIDPETADVVLISIPRDISDFPLYDGRTFTGKINSFQTWVRNHPDDFEDSPLAALRREVGVVICAPIHYYAAVDLAGFREMIDRVGGVTIENQRAINDPRYDWLDGRFGFRLSAGTHELDGDTALAYVRSRQGVGDSDFRRSRRQQQVLLALREKLTSPEMLPELPGILDAAADTVKTNFPSERIGEMIELAQRVDSSKVRQYVLGPSKYSFRVPYEETGGEYKLRLKMDALEALSIDVFGEDSRYWDPSAAGGSASPSP